MPLKTCLIGLIACRTLTAVVSIYVFEMQLMGLDGSSLRSLEKVPEFGKKKSKAHRGDDLNHLLVLLFGI